MRLLVERDDRSVIDVEAVIRWSQTDDFWAANVLSPGKLRKQFASLWGQMNRPSNHNGAGDEQRERQARRLAALERLANGGAR